MNRAMTFYLASLLSVCVFSASCTSTSRPELCKTNDDCASLERCKEGVCVEVECIHTGDCPSGKYCVDFHCIDNQVCSSDDDCVDPTPVCDTQSGKCVECVPDCTGVCCGDDGCGGTCEDNCAQTDRVCNEETCQCEGECVPACDGKECGPDGCDGQCGPGCGEGENCVDGLCQASGCQSDDDCVAPTPKCQVDTGACVQCLQSGDCANGKICSAGICVEQPTCTDDDQCEMGQICVDGACVTGCHSDRDCPASWHCLTDQGPNGTCIECLNDDECQPGTACSDGRCVEHCTEDAHCAPLHCDLDSNHCVTCTQDAHCDDGKICEDFSCQEGCRTDEDCPGGHCNPNTLLCAQCVTTDNCALGSLCIDEQCVPGCQSDRDCPQGLMCDTNMGEHGSCVECLGNDDCAQSFHCVDGLCEFFCSSDNDCEDPRPACDNQDGVCVECTSNDHCVPGTICVDLACLPGCERDRDCPEGLVCDETAGDHGECVVCITDADCLEGLVCDNNACIISGSDMVRIPGGAFVRGSVEGQGDPDEEPQKTLIMPTFYIDRTEVTNAQYHACVDAFACTEPSDTTDYDDPSKASNPVVFVDWGQARDFCQWMNKYLPTEARWEMAARGDDGRVYPWGNSYPDCAKANFSGCSGHTAPVGTHPAGASLYGALDMAGNVYEWVNDRYSETYYADAPMEDPLGPADGDLRVIRGGGFSSMPENIRVANRSYLSPDTGREDLGFRCALRGVPTADFTLNPESGPYADTVFAVDASSSSDPNHSIDQLEVRWDWENDDAWDTDWSFAKTASHRYAFGGIFRIKLQVRDPDGNDDIIGHDVVVETDSGWDGASCTSDQDCAPGFVCVWSGFVETVCREDCTMLFDTDCHIANRACSFTIGADSQLNYACTVN